jgi:hypothetical protein
MKNLESVMECQDEGLSGSSDISTPTVKSNSSRRRGKVCSEQTAFLRSNELQQPPIERSKNQ